MRSRGYDSDAARERERCLVCPPARGLRMTDGDLCLGLGSLVGVLGRCKGLTSPLLLAASDCLALAGPLLHDWGCFGFFFSRCN